MIVTGIAPAPEKLHERTDLPSGELIYLAKEALKQYSASHLITSLAAGWEQSLAKAAIELDHPFTVVIPYPGYENMWDAQVRRSYLQLLAKARKSLHLSAGFSPAAEMEAHIWCVDHTEAVLSLWDYDFGSETYSVMSYALKRDKIVANLWQDWQHLYSMRRPVQRTQPAQKKSGVRVFDSKTGRAM